MPQIQKWFSYCSEIAMLISLKELNVRSQQTFCKGSESKYFRFYESFLSFVTSIPLCCCKAKSAIDNM